MIFTSLKVTTPEPFRMCRYVALSRSQHLRHPERCQSADRGMVFGSNESLPGTWHSLGLVETLVGTQEYGGESYRVDLFVKPERNPAEPEGPLIWKGESPSPMGFVVRGRSLPELVVTAERHARELGASGHCQLRIYLIPDKVPPEPVVELHIDGLGGSSE
jgi:hypothetical protein